MTTCRDVMQLAPEFALALLDGTNRANVITHLDECDECRAAVAGYREAVDVVVGDVPESDPAPGFSHRVLERIEATQTPEPIRTRRRSPRGVVGWLGAAAAAAAVIIGLVVSNLGATPPAVAMKAGPLTDASGAARGDAFLAGGSHPWLFMRVQLAAKNYYAVTTTYSCELVLDDGHAVTMGTFTARDGVGEWGGSVDVAANHVVAARVISTSGELLAEAKLH